MDESNNLTKRWLCAEIDAARREDLAREAGISPVIAGLLLARNIGSVEEAREFLEPDLEHLHDPFLIPGMETAVERLLAALRDRERILVHGDYDVDGVTAAALLTRVLRTLGGDVEPFVPHRIADGYDLQPETVRRKAAEGFRLIVTVDCGIVAFEAAACARELGVDLIITDHHEPQPELPPALAIVHPRLSGSEYPFPYLSGVGVAFKLATALVRRMGVTERTFRMRYLDLVALGTAADCMPLVGENRVFVTFGLQALQQTNKVGLRALIKSAGLAGTKLSARTLGFVLGPRINAVGRLDAASHALELMLTSDAGAAQQLAELLERANLERQETQHRIFEEARELARRMDLAQQRVLVLASQGWHPGVIGIVASKLVEEFGRPAVMIALDGDSEAKGRGSARSIHDFNIFAAIEACRELLGRCGGHEGAAGFDIEPENVDAFRSMLCRVAEEKCDEELFAPRLNLDAYLDSAELDMALARELARLAPFGHGNPEPLFGTRAIRIAQVQTLNPKQPFGVPHLKLRLSANGGRPLEAYYWRNGHIAEELAQNMPLDLCYRLEVNEYLGRESLRLTVQDLRISQDTHS